LVHADGSKEQIKANHTYNQQQIAWFREGSALNVIKKENAS
jgi:aconitate hydratase